MRAPAIVLAALSLLLLLARCAGDSTVKSDPSGPGWTVTLTTRVPKASMYASYELSRDGLLTYTAGRGMSSGGVAWKGQLTGEEIRSVTELVEANRQPEKTPVPDDEVPVRQYLLRTTAPGSLLSSTIQSGPTPYLDRLYDLFRSMQMARRRELLEPIVTTPVK